MSLHTLHKHERIKSRKLIASLFAQGKKIRKGPFLLIYKEVEAELRTSQLMFGVSVSKRKFKRAVDRNTIKRKVREVYRLSKTELLTKLESGDNAHALFVVYLGADLGHYHKLSRAMDLLLKKWLEEISLDRKKNN